jgi:hypothetical protein
MRNINFKECAFCWFTLHNCITNAQYKKHKSDTIDKNTKPQQIRNTDELKFTVEHILDNDDILYMFHVKEEKLNSCPQGPM